MKKRILIIEPDGAIAGRIAGTLSNHHLDVAVAGCGRAGLQAAHDNPPDILLLNPDLEDMDGEHVYWSLKRDPRTMHAPVIILADTNHVQRVLERFPLGSVEYHLPRSAFVQYILIELLRYWGYIGQSLRLPRQRAAHALPAG